MHEHAWQRVFRNGFDAVILAMGLLGAATAVAGADAAKKGGETVRWWRGNLHTHSLWSDGDDYPEMIADWYKDNGYHFLAISDHNVVQQGQRWLELKDPVAIGADIRYRGGGPVLDRYLARFGPAWVERRQRDGKQEVRLKPLPEYRALLEEAGRFLLIPSEEISAEWKRGQHGGPIHVNATNVHEHIAPVKGRDALTVMQRNVDRVLEQRARTGQAMFPHLNHPNYKWAVTPEELMRVKGERFFEIYNGHSSANNAGDATHLGAEQMWDVILAHRIAVLNLEPMFGIAVDDAHHYHAIRLGKQNAGRGWVMVRAPFLTPESIVHAMEAGDFYSSTGVTLADVSRSGNRLALAVQAEPGVQYTIQFIGTRRNFDRRSEVVPAARETTPRTLPHRRYSADIGAVLAEVRGSSAEYVLKGDELYVRAKVSSSKPKPNASTPGEFEVAWTQPLFPPAGRP